MEVISTQLKGVHVLKPCTIFEDFRGDYVEIYNKELYFSAGIDTEFVQDDYSTSTKHVLRGFHGDNLTAKLIKCLHGTLYSVIVNNDPESDEYKKWTSFTLSSTNRKQVFIPPKFGNAFLVLSDTAVFHYKQSTYYGHEQFTIKWNDPDYNFWWPLQNPITSLRDSND